VTEFNTTVLLPKNTEQFYIWITFLRHHTHELQTFKYNLVFS